MDRVFKTVCVCGAGTMGSGIAQVSAMAGYHTVLYDLNEEIINKAKANIDRDLQKLVEKQKISEAEKSKIFHHFEFTSDLNNAKADLIIEAIIEELEAKLFLFGQLVTINSTHTIYASNTSSLSITKIAEQLSGPQIIGLHFFNPAPLMKLVEVVSTGNTAKQTLSAAVSFVKSLQKIPVVCKDSPGFIVNRVARPFYIEALRILEEGKISFETIDRLIEARGFKMGPFKLMDLIGNDINYAVSCSVYEQLQKPMRLKPSPIQKEKVEKGNLGRKTGSGYYQY